MQNICRDCSLEAKAEWDITARDADTQFSALLVQELFSSLSKQLKVRVLEQEDGG